MLTLLILSVLWSKRHNVRRFLFQFSPVCRLFAVQCVKA